MNDNNFLYFIYIANVDRKIISLSMCDCRIAKNKASVVRNGTCLKKKKIIEKFIRMYRSLSYFILASLILFICFTC